MALGGAIGVPDRPSLLRSGGLTKPDAGRSTAGSLSRALTFYDTGLAGGLQENGSGGKWGVAGARDLSRPYWISREKNC